MKVFPALPPRSQKFRDEMAGELIELSRQGATIAEVCAEMCISRATYRAWINEESPTYRPDFAEAAAIGDELRQAYYTRVGRQHLTYDKEGPRVDAALLKSFLQAVSPDWRDRSEVTVPQLPQAVFAPFAFTQPTPPSDEDSDA